MSSVKKAKFIPVLVGCIFQAIYGFSLKNKRSKFFKEAIIALYNTSHEALGMKFD